MSSPTDAHREQLLENIAAGITPKNRYWTTIAAQTGGLILLVLLGILVFPAPSTADTPEAAAEVQKGLDFIRLLIIVYLGGSFLGGLLPAIAAYARQAPEVYTHPNVDLSVWAFVWLDMNILLLLVCQENGLSHSIFLPVFLLIPIAYVHVERADKRHRAMVILGTTIVYMLITYYMSDQHHLNLWAIVPVVLLSLITFILISADRYRKSYRYIIITFVLITSLVLPYLLRNNHYWPSWPIDVTDFHEHAHVGFDRALFWASFFSAVIPFVQILIILFQNRSVRLECAVPVAETGVSGGK